jgi:hypothetical protein
MPLKVACLSCGHEESIPEGTDLRGVACARCRAPLAAHFPHEKMLRFEKADDPRLLTLTELARGGRVEEALGALEELLRSGYDDLDRIGADPALAALRADRRYRELLRKIR